MKKIKVIVISTVLMMLFAFSALAMEGMVPIGLDDTNVTYYYMLENSTPIKNAWKEAWGNWYYFGDDGVSKQSMWFEVDGKWYYFDEKSVMLHDTTTPDGYTVGADGAWVTE